MAYMSFTEFDGAAAPLATDASIAPAGFSGLEWSVIALAQRDRLASLREPGRMARALGSLFGTSGNPRLADGRLEALRRLAVLAWHKSYVLPMSEVRAFLAAGFSQEQYETLLRSISHGRSQPRKQRA